jgi:hypothetical protein
MRRLLAAAVAKRAHWGAGRALAAAAGAPAARAAAGPPAPRPLGAPAPAAPRARGFAPFATNTEGCMPVVDEAELLQRQLVEVGWRCGVRWSAALAPSPPHAPPRPPQAGEGGELQRVFDLVEARGEDMDEAAVETALAQARGGGGWVLLSRPSLHALDATSIPTRTHPKIPNPTPPHPTPQAAHCALMTKMGADALAREVHGNATFQLLLGEGRGGGESNKGVLRRAAPAASGARAGPARRCPTRAPCCRALRRRADMVARGAQRFSPQAKVGVEHGGARTLSAGCDSEPLRPSPPPHPSPLPPTAPRRASSASSPASCACAKAWCTTSCAAA